MLNDEVLNASGASGAARAAYDPDAPRYGEQANIENHPQVTDFVPRRKLAAATTLLAGLGTATATAAVAHYSESIAAALSGVTASELAERAAGGVAAWATAVAMLLIAVLAKLTFSLRRHRVNDYAGRYRVWKWVGWGALGVSVNAVAPVHGLLASAATSASGWSLTAAGAEWWLAPAALLGGWVLVRLLLEIRESRAATTFAAAATLCYVAAAAGALGFAPAALGAWESPIKSALPLAGATLALVGMMVFARYVVLDVQGLIDHAPRQAAEKPAVVEREAATTAKVEAKPASAAAAQANAAEESPYEDDWSDDDEEGYGNRKLSKAEKKRLRRQNRAA